MNPIQGKSIAGRESIDHGLKDFMVSTYRLIALGLLASTFTAFLTYQPAVLSLIVGPEGLNGLGWAVTLAPIGILLLMMFGMVGKTTASMKVVFWSFVLLNGPSLGLLTMMYTGTSVVNAALAAACMFMGASLYGYVSKKDLTSFGSFMVVGLIGILVASVINLFIGSSMMQWVISVMGVLIFTGLTAWETQSLKNSYDDAHNQEHTQYMFALNLYLNIINLFRFILSLTGSKE